MHQLKPNLVLIEGTKATRYVEGKSEQQVQIDYSIGLKQVREDIEYFRAYGIPMQEDE